MNFLPRILCAATTAGLVLGCLGPVWAQQAPTETMPKRGIIPTGAYAVSDLETINVVNGNVFYRIPLTSLAPGRAGWTAGVNLTYNSQIYDIFPELGFSNLTGDPTIVDYLRRSLSGGGWQYGFAYSMNLDIRPNLNSGFTCTDINEPWKAYRLSLIFPDGSHHTLHLFPGYGHSEYLNTGYYDVDPGGSASVCSSAISGDLVYYTTDGSYTKVVFNASGGSVWHQRPWTIYFRDGRKVNGVGAQTTEMLDPNGNKVSVINSSPGGILQTQLIDDLGKSITIQYTNSSQDTITQTGANGTPLQWIVNWTPISLAGSTLSYTCTFPQGDHCPASSLYSWGVSSIQLPTSQQFTFGYDSVQGWGELNHVTLPSGAAVDYQYLRSNSLREGANITENPISSKTVTWTDPADNSPRTEVSSYSFTNISSQIGSPDGSHVQNAFYDSQVPWNPFAGLVFKTVQPDGSTVERAWQQNAPYGAVGNPFVKYEFQSVAANGSPVLESAKAFSFDRNGNATQVVDYDWVAYNALQHDSYGAPSGLPNLTPLHTTNNSYIVATSTSANQGVDDSNGYWHPGSPTVTALVATSATTGAGPGSSSAFHYGDTSGHPNLVDEQHYDNVTGWMITHYGYDGYGNRTSVQNPRGYTTAFTYNASNCLTQKTLAAGTPREQIFTYTCEANWGLTDSETDVGHQITRTYGYDRFGRNSHVTETGGGLTRNKDTDYNDINRTVTVAADLGTINSQFVRTSQITNFDPLNRVWQTVDPAGNKVQTRFYTPQNGGFSYRVTSNPYVTQGESTMGWTRTKLDPNGRVVEVKHFTGSALPAPWPANNSTTTGAVTTTYSWNTSTVTDEAGVSRVNVVDGAGRLSQVTETGINATTAYLYDALDGLTLVAQPGSANRSFVYSSS